ncbi:MAG: hypothetical protein GX112_14940 [Clostridiaceae bacterium]|jgi:ABC-type transport system substrate-binding protein|nr:hypothetical protein [Clostridiaceae bacterium]
MKQSSDLEKQISQQPEASARPAVLFARWQHILYGVILTALIVLLTVLALEVGRWQQEQAGRTTGPAPTTSGAAAALPDSAYARQDRLLVGVNDRFEQLNPLYASGDGELDLVSLVFEALVRLDADANPIGQLAESWQFDADQHLLRVNLRTDHTFRDGRVVLPEDVVYTYACLLSPAYDGPLKSRLGSLVQVSAFDDQTVHFQFSDQVTDPDLRLLTVGVLKADYYPFQPERIFELRDSNLHPEGSGAFSVSETSANHVVLALRPGYAGQVKTIEIRQVASEAKLRLLQEAELDIVRNLWDARMQQRALALPFYSFFPYETSVDQYLLVNPQPQSGSLIQRPSQRLAVLLTAAGRPLSRLQQAALAELESLELHLHYFSGVDPNVLYTNREQAEQIAATLALAGLQVLPKAADWPELAERAANHDYDLLLLPATANSRLPDQAVILGDPVQPDSSAWVVAYRPDVLIVCNRLSQVTINPYKHPFAASSGSWTDRIENIRILQPEEPET